MTSKAPWTLAVACAATLVVAACGNPPALRSEVQPTPDQVSLASDFLESEVQAMVAACEAQNEHKSNERPPEPPDDLTIDGYTPLIGPDCSTGYVKVPKLGADEPSQVVRHREVRSEPHAESVVVGYIFEGLPGWYSIERIEKAGLSVSEIASAAAETRHTADRP